MTESLDGTGYGSLLLEVQGLLELETRQAGEAEHERVERYWEVGRRILPCESGCAPC